MRLGRIQHDGVARGVVLREDGLHLLEGPLWAQLVGTGEVVPAAGARWLAPVRPGKIVCVGRNYRAHARELGHEVPAEPLLFLKPPSAVLDPEGVIRLPAQSARVEHEGELAVVIARVLRDATPEQCLAGVLGYTCANDVTARDLQRRDVQFTRAKGFDTFCPLGPWIETGPVDEATALRVRVNGALRQQGVVGDMVFPVAGLLAYITRVMTLEPGDVVLTGTPEGVGPLCEGDRVEVEITGVGTLCNRVAPPAAVFNNLER